MNERLQIGIIGLDTSHVPAFTELLNRTDHAYHVPGGRVVAAFPGGSPDFELSRSRVQGYSDTLAEAYGVQMLDTIEEVAERCDALLLESVDGRVHPEQFRRIAPFGKPVFIDKPFALSSAAAAEIAAAAREYRVPLMSCSAVRYAEVLTEALGSGGRESIYGMDCYGPTAHQETQPGLFWYGVHTVDMLYEGMGRGCVQVTATGSEHHDLVVGRWRDGRVGTIRGNRAGNSRFGALVHRADGTAAVDVHAHAKPYYASLLERIMTMFQGGGAAIRLEETLEIVRFIEAANESLATGRTVVL